ncbi:hypothetical protein AQUCO_12500005v1 [Aquilegia coerulea]|uniref:Uncharacterized protein n=1 Tax=Aquilegia coerulea TaxID=218851 RepID=A0A2G5C1D6_AQUCA|nr:hypothetical protein AQUCO_12500005v1 [Aquilegia coerulea]
MCRTFFFIKTDLFIFKTITKQKQNKAKTFKCPTKALESNQGLDTHEKKKNTRQNKVEYNFFTYKDGLEVEALG